MSMFLRPLCGKQNSIKKYQSENFDDDVEIFHNASLGYRKGFEKIMGYDLFEFPELRAHADTPTEKTKNTATPKAKARARAKTINPILFQIKH